MSAVTHPSSDKRQRRLTPLIGRDAAEPLYHGGVDEPRRPRPDQVYHLFIYLFIYIYIYLFIYLWIIDDDVAVLEGEITRTTL